MDNTEFERSRIKHLFGSIDVGSIEPVAVEGYYYRVVSYKRSRTMLSTKGAVLTGGRYNYKPPQTDSFATLYCSQTNFTAIQERFYNLITKNKPLPPHTISSVRVELTQVWDFSSPELCKRVNIDWDELNGTWEYYQDILAIPAYTQLIGELAFTSGIEAIKFESTKYRDTYNLAIFENNISAAAINLYDPRGELK